jgi:hypothetical protein
MTSQFPPQQPWGPYQQQPPPQPPAKKKHTFRNIVLSLGGMFLVLIIAIAATSGGGSGAGNSSSTGSSGTAASSGSGTDQAAAAATPAAAPVHHRKIVTYVVTGSPADVTYGPAGSDLNGDVPMHVTKKLKHPAFYAISAQLQGGGSVRCEIKVNGKVVSKAHATGGYNIADCEITRNIFSGKWEDTNSG